MNDIAADIMGIIGPLFVIGFFVYLLTRGKRYKGKSKDTQKLEPRWEFILSYLGGRFKEISLDGVRAVYCYDYYPTGKFEDISDKDLLRRDEILRFKEGDSTPMAEQLMDFICGNFWKVSLSQWMICAIPASTREKHARRYAKLLQDVADETGIGNGFECIRIKFDRKDSREKKQSNTVYNLEFDRTKIRGKWVLLIDDVTTRGTSFSQCAQKLYACGAQYVCGFFLGKTVNF